jgi:two-component system response regulator MprA
LRQVPARILVVDDDPDTRSLMLDILEAETYEVQACSSGEEAMTTLQREPFDVVLSDIRMPNITGIDLLLHVRQNGLDVEVILMTAYASVETAVQALRGQAFDYLIKPFSLAEVRTCVRSAIGARSAKPRRHNVESVGGLTIDYKARRVWADGREVKRTVVTMEDFLSDVWGCDGSEERSPDTVRTCIRRIRKAIRDDAQEPRYIHNVWGVGYKLGD